MAVRSGENQGLYLFLVLHFLKRACLFKMVRKAFLKNDQVISFQDTRARSIRKACSLKCFRVRLTVMRGGRLTADPLRMQVMIADILVEDSRGVFGGPVG